MPAYLADSSLAVRHGTNEIEYLPATLWGERLDNSFQRVLGANLAALSPAAQIRLNSWGSREVTAEIYVSVEQFDLDASGRGVLVARWRVDSPGDEKTLKAGESRFSRQGANPDNDPAGAVATLSELLADLSRQLAGILRDAGPVHADLPN